MGELIQTIQSHETNFIEKDPCSYLLKTTPVYFCAPDGIFNATSFHSQTCPNLDDNFHGHLEHISKYMHGRNTFFFIAAEKHECLSTCYVILHNLLPL